MIVCGGYDDGKGAVGWQISTIIAISLMTLRKCIAEMEVEEAVSASSNLFPVYIC